MRFDFSMNGNYGDLFYVENWDIQFDEIRDQADLCEKIGITTFWVPEHHFAGIDGWNNAAPNPVLVCMDVAARTSRLRVGTGGISLPDWHPLRVAEDIALLDNATKGRVDFGVMRGGSKRTNIQFNEHQRDIGESRKLFDESLSVIRSAWSQSAFRHKGSFYEFPVPGYVERDTAVNRSRHHYKDNGELVALNVHPKPFQKPGPPVWLLSNSASSFSDAGGAGFNVMSYCMNLADMSKNWALYRAARQNAKGDVGEMPCGLAVMRPFYIAPTDEEAFGRARAGINTMFGRSSVTVQGRKPFIPEGEELSEADMKDDWFDFLIRHKQIFIGSSKRVLDDFVEHRERVGCDHIALMGNVPGVNHEQLLASLKLLGKDIMPHLT